MKVGKLNIEGCRLLEYDIWPVIFIVNWFANFHRQGFEIVCENGTFVTNSNTKHNLWHHQIKCSNTIISGTK